MSTANISRTNKETVIWTLKTATITGLASNYIFSKKMRIKKTAFRAYPSPICDRLFLLR